jgi:uncharacterized membrane protein YqiK
MEWFTIVATGVGFIFLLMVVFYGLSIVIIDDTQVGIVTKKFGTKSLPGDRVIATQGEAGIQADTLPPGWHFWLWFWQYSVEKVPMVTIEQGKIGLIVAVDGAQPDTNRLLGKIVKSDNYQNGKAFLENGGEKGKQMGILTAGKYRINTKLFQVLATNVTEIKTGTVGIVTTMDGSPLNPGEIAGEVIDGHNNFQDVQAFILKGGRRGLQEQVILAGQWNLNPWFVSVKTVPMTNIPIGHVGVVTSFIGQAHQDISGESFKHGDLVEKGHKGVWAEPLYPGLHALNTDTMKVDLVPTTNVVLNWATNRSESHKLDENLSSITVRSKDGFSYNLDVSVVIHVGAKEASRVISRMGSMSGLISQVLEPTIGNYFRNSAQEYAALDFLKQRTEMQKKASQYVATALKEYDVEAVDTLIGDIVLPKELLETQTQRKLAEEMQKTYETQQVSQKQKEALNRQTAITEIQSQIVGSEQGVRIAEMQAQQATKAAEGQTKVAEQKALQTIKVAESEATAAKLRAEAEATALKLKAEAEAIQIEKTQAAHASGVLANGKAQAEAHKLAVDAMGRENYTVLFGLFMQTVKEMYEINEDDLEERAEDSEYWASAYNFYLDNKNKPADRLTDKQAAWMEKIEEQLNR